MESAIQNIKRLVAVDKKFHEAPVFLTPKEDQKTRKVFDYAARIPKELRDAISISLDAKRDRDGIVVDEMYIKIQHLQVFDLNNPNDALLFEVIKDDPMIAHSKGEVNPASHRYYIEDKEKEAVETISKSKLKSKAFDVIKNLSTGQMENYARIVGKFVRGLSSTQVESALYEVADKTPQLILDIDSDKDLKHKIFLRRCLDSGLISMDNGKYMNGKDLIGINESYAIMWLKDPDNRDLITQWHRLLEGGPNQVLQPVGSSESVVKAEAENATQNA